MSNKKRWSELSSGQQVAVVTLGALQVGLAVVAWVDLARRPAERVNGPKPLWAAAIAINTVGPVAYFWKGRRR